MARRCSVDNGPTGKYVASAYWAWFPEPDQRVAYKSLYCGEHADVLIDLIKQSIEYRQKVSNEEPTTCPSCGSDTLVEHAWTWANVYIPGSEETKLTFEHCFADAMQLWSELSAGGEKLPDRNSIRAGAPEASPWAKLPLF